MKDIGHDPVDHPRTTRKHAGETMKHEQQRPGSGRGGHGRRCTDGGLVRLRHQGHAVAGTTCAVLGGGLTWSAFTHREVRSTERKWLHAHPAAPS